MWETTAGVGSPNNKDSAFSSISRWNKRAGVTHANTWSTSPWYQSIPVDGKTILAREKVSSLNHKRNELIWIYLPYSFFGFI